jgi:hypothetical protein
MRNSPDRFSCARDRKPTRAPFSRPFRAFSMGCGAISDPLSLFLSWPPKPDRSVVRNKHEPIRHLILKNNIMLKPGLSRNCRFSLRAPGPARPLPHRLETRGSRSDNVFRRTVRHNDRTRPATMHASARFGSERSFGVWGARRPGDVSRARSVGGRPSIDGAIRSPRIHPPWRLTRAHLRGAPATKVALTPPLDPSLLGADRKMR